MGRFFIIAGYILAIAFNFVHCSKVLPRNSSNVAQNGGQPIILQYSTAQQQQNLTKRFSNSSLLPEKNLVSGGYRIEGKIRKF